MNKQQCSCVLSAPHVRIYVRGGVPTVKAGKEEISIIVNDSVQELLLLIAYMLQLECKGSLAAMIINC